MARALLPANCVLLGILIGLIANRSVVAVSFVAFGIAVLDLGASATQLRTVLAVDRASRRWTVAHGPRQADTAREAYDELYGKADR